MSLRTRIGVRAVRNLAILLLNQTRELASWHLAGLALAPPRESVQQPTISLLLERRDEASGERFTSLAVAPGETIKSVKLRVAKRSAFTSRHCLVRNLSSAVPYTVRQGSFQSMHNSNRVVESVTTWPPCCPLMRHRFLATVNCWRTM